MIKRLLTGIALVFIVTGFFLLRKIDIAYFEILVMLFIIAGSFEITRALGTRITAFQKSALLLYAVIFVPLFTLWGLNALLALCFILGIIFISALVFDKDSTMENTGLSFLASFYPSILLSSMLFLNRLESNATLALLLVFIISPASDTFAYMVGCTVKGKKLCPSISPHKTISGAIGGLIGGAAGSVVLYFIFSKSFIYSGAIPEIMLFIIIGLIGAAFTVFGDLTESVIKRKLGVKDMGRLLPGHGGILDRIDGVMFTSAFILFFFKLFI